MRLKLVKVLTQEAVIDLPDYPTPKALVAHAEALVAQKEPDFTPPVVRHRFVAEVCTDDGGALVLNHEGRVLVTDAARAAFTDLANGVPSTAMQPSETVHIDLEDE